MVEGMEECNEWEKKNRQKKKKPEEKQMRVKGADINFGRAAAATLIKPRF